MLLRRVRRLSAAQPCDVRVDAGRVVACAPRLARRAGETVHDAAGALAIPGLWDQHVHVGQAAQGRTRWDTSGLTSVPEAVRAVAAELRRRGTGTRALIGYGHSLTGLDGVPTVAALDAVAGPRTPVVLIGGDSHHAWMSSAALACLGLSPRDGIVAEDEWFDVVGRLDLLPGVAEDLEADVLRLQRDALARGVTGIVDMEWAENWRLWEQREPLLRVRTATYQGDLGAVPGPTGTAIGTSGLVEMGPLKVILDGSLGSRSAWCRHAYPGPDGRVGGHGVLSVPADELAVLLDRAREAGLDAALHAIGDAAVGVVLETISRGPGHAPRRVRIEHAQMLTDADVAAIARLGVTASMQPAHLLGDRDPTEELWGPEARQAFRLRDLLDAGARIELGSDAPVAPLDPWLAMSAAVHRSADDREAWFPAQQLQPREALAASTDGVGEVVPGARGDVVLLADDPFDDVPCGADGLMDEAAAREAATRLREAPVLATLVAGRLAWSR